jgi:hypothetical protein
MYFTLSSDACRYKDAMVVGSDLSINGQMYHNVSQPTYDECVRLVQGYDKDYICAIIVPLNLEYNFEE